MSYIVKFDETCRGVGEGGWWQDGKFFFEEIIFLGSYQNLGYMCNTYADQRALTSLPISSMCPFVQQM